MYLWVFLHFLWYDSLYLGAFKIWSTFAMDFFLAIKEKMFGFKIELQVKGGRNHFSRRGIGPVLWCHQFPCSSVSSECLF